MGLCEHAHFGASLTARDVALSSDRDVCSHDLIVP